MDFFIDFCILKFLYLYNLIAIAFDNQYESLTVTQTYFIQAIALQMA